jgi:hypothetical protein
LTIEKPILPLKTSLKKTKHKGGQTICVGMACEPLPEMAHGHPYGWLRWPTVGWDVFFFFTIFSFLIFLKNNDILESF